MVLSQAGFNLRKRATNDSKLQKFFETKILNETEITFSEEQLGPTKNNYKKVLGLEWDMQNDEIFFRLFFRLFVLMFGKDFNTY